MKPTVVVVLRISLCLAIAAWALVGVSCESLPTLVNGASLTFKGRSQDIVRDAVVDVFTDHGFRVASPFGSTVILEKPGSFNDELMYGIWTPHVTTSRVEMTFQSDDDKSVRVTCHAIIVRDEGGMFGEEKNQLLANGRFRCQKYLEEARRQLMREHP